MAQYLGWITYHTHDSRRSDPGFPDLVLVREKVKWREVETDKGRMSPAQMEWQRILKDAGQDVGIWRPAMWDEIEKELR